MALTQSKKPANSQVKCIPRNSIQQRQARPKMTIKGSTKSISWATASHHIIHNNLRPRIIGLKLLQKSELVAGSLPLKAGLTDPRPGLIRKTQWNTTAYHQHHRQPTFWSTKFHHSTNRVPAFSQCHSRLGRQCLALTCQAPQCNTHRVATPLFTLWQSNTSC